MQSLTLPFSEAIASQIVNEILANFFDSQLTSKILASNQFSQKFYRNFFDSTVQEALRSTILPNKNFQFELLQRPKSLSQFDQQPLVNPPRKVKISSISKILEKKSQEKPHLQCQKSVKKTKNYLQSSKKNLSVNKSDKKLQVIKNPFKQLKEKKVLPSLNLKRKDKNSIKLAVLEVQNKVEEPETLQIEDEFRQSEQKKNQEQKCRVDYKKVTKQRNSLQRENFPLLQNVNPIKTVIAEKGDEQYKKKLKNAKNQLLKAHKKYQIDKKKDTSLHPNKRKMEVKSLSGSKFVPQSSSQNYLKFGQKKIDLRRNLSHQTLDMKKNVSESQKKSLIILGGRQRRASQLKIHSTINKILNECKQKNTLRIQQHKGSSAFPVSISPKKNKQKIIINNKEKAQILISSTNQILTYLQVESGIPNLTQKDKRRISVKLI